MTDSADAPLSEFSAVEPANGIHSLIGRVRETAATQLTWQKNRATDGLVAVAQAVRQSMRPLRDREHDVLAQYVERAADRIDGFSRRVRQKDIAELARDVEDLGRRQPAIFLGGALALGLVGARVFGRPVRALPREASEGRGAGPIEFAVDDHSGATAEPLSPIREDSGPSDTTPRIGTSTLTAMGSARPAPVPTPLERMMEDTPLLVGAGVLMLGAAFGLALMQSEREAR
jgi:hypothetical protein